MRYAKLSWLKTVNYGYNIIFAPADEESRDLELFRDIFAFVGLSQYDSSVLFSDSRGAIQNAKHPSFSEKLRSALNSIFYIREVVELMICTVRYIPTKLNPADLGTKALGYVLFRLHGQFLMNDTLSAATSADKNEALGTRFTVVEDVVTEGQRLMTY